MKSIKIQKTIENSVAVSNSVVEPEPHGAETFGWSRNIEVSAPAPAPAPGSGSTKEF